MTIWYEVLAAINEVSKDLQSKDICINVAIEQVQGLIAYFEKYRETGFAEDMINAKKLAIEMEIDSVFPEKRQRRFEEYQAYDDIFGFLFISERLNSMDNDKLKDCCDRLQNFLKKCEFFDVDGDALFVELKLLQEPLPKEMKTSIDILNYLKRMRDCKHCVQNLVDCTCYRCICGKKFLKVKVIKIILAINYVAGKVKWTCFDID
ncbi:hypothetical protein ACFX15_002112 [Malus domestica]